MSHLDWFARLSITMATLAIVAGIVYFVASIRIGCARPDHWHEVKRK